ncbi:zinc finger protein 79-like [Dunckerocampus dactyliophorus]|uniref:zinc finger protein 79-like n=1 Tax=Dunckerocampus dactyliophorus TaxID=161453 RepID=UPI002407113C|nr:zinc finger protein 79-like [Dunckerocampus dactyliophorus]
MSKVEMLRLLINQRLAEVADEIFGVFGRTIAEFEEELCRSRREIERQRRLLDFSIKTSNRAAPREPQDWTSGLDLEEHVPPPIKEEEEQQDDTPPGSEPGGMFSFPSGDLEWADGVSPTSDLPSQNTDNSDAQAGTSVQHTYVDPAAPLSDEADSYICSICGRTFARRGPWSKHMRDHAKQDVNKADKSYICTICGKRLTRFDGYRKHLRVHTGERPYRCAACGRRFSDNSNYRRHVRTCVQISQDAAHT